MGIPFESLRQERINMKFFAAIALACLASSVSAEITCDDCLTFSGNMQTYLMSGESVAEQTELLVALLCPQAEDAAGCEAGFWAWWAKIAAAMYPEFLEANSICGQLGACGIKTLLGEPTCDECTASLGAVADIIGSEGKIAEIVEFLKGDAFCVGSPDADTCAIAIEGTMPYAMPVLAGVLVERAAEYCCTQSPSGVCC